MAYTVDRNGTLKERPHPPASHVIADWKRALSARARVILQGTTHAPRELTDYADLWILLHDMDTYIRGREHFTAPGPVPEWVSTHATRI